MWDTNWRDTAWSELNQKWDLIIIGGGITGAGIFNLAARKGLHVLLLEASDFAFGTSSRSSKLVHGGLRYLRNKQFDVVRESVKERERLIKEAPGLVNKLSFIFPGFTTDVTSQITMSIGVIIYDLLAPKWDHRILSPNQVFKKEPILRHKELTGANQYYDASVDDSRLVLRVIQDGVRSGGIALNYTKASSLLKNAKNKIIGVIAEDQTPENTHPSLEIQAAVVINASGPWSDEVRKNVNGTPRLRKLRGSHLIFSREKLPINHAVTMLHPRDGRALFAIPWEGVSMIGTTDLDQQDMDKETSITAQEVDYLIDAANFAFPGRNVSCDDVISTFSGLRPVINTGAATPSQESRAHQVWEEDGLITVSGGKLSIFRVMAADVLNYISNRLPGNPKFDHRDQIFEPPPKKPETSNLAPDTWLGLAGRHGQDVIPLLESASPASLTSIQPLSNLWAEINWAAKQEAVVHLDDLMLRRVRLGLCLPNGGMDHLGKIKNLIQKELGWSDRRWKKEVSRYQDTWKKYYYLP